MADTSRPTSAPSTSASPGSGAGGTDWPAQVADTVVGYVDQAKEKINGPAGSAARGVVYGTLAAIVGTAALVLFVIFLFRAVDVGVDALLDLAGIEKPGRSTWITHGLFGAVMALVGASALKRGRRPAPTA